MTIQLSQEIFAISHGEDFIIYAPIRGVALLCNASMANLIRRLSEGDHSILTDPVYAETTNTLWEAGLLVEVEDVAEGILVSEQTGSEFFPTRATFLVTTNCNLRCVYCYASAGERHITIPFEICKAAIDLIASNAKQLNVADFHIAFHGGGEPTTAFPLLKQCVEYAQMRAEHSGIQSSFSVVTNGVLTNTQIEWLAANMNGISISLDGTPEIQNMQRPLRNGGKSFDQVFTTIKTLERLGVRPFVRATITNTSVSRMGKISRFFSESFEAPEFQLEPVAVCGRCNTSGYKEPTVVDFVNGVEAAMMEAAKFGKRAVCSAALETFPNLMEAYCGIAAPNFAITPEGIVTACYEVATPDDPRGEYFYYGRYDFAKGCFVFDDSAIVRLRNHVVQNIQRCKDCFCRWQCAGDCPVRSAWQFPSDAVVGNADFRCQMTRELVRRRLVRSLEEAQLNANAQFGTERR